MSSSTATSPTVVPDSGSRSGFRRWRGAGLVLALIFLAALGGGGGGGGRGEAAPAPRDGSLAFTGCCDASAATGITPALFAAGSDEDNVLRLYRRQAGGPTVSAVNVSGFLGVGRQDECDLEAATTVGNRVYWIGSHSRNADGKARPARHVFFATEVRTNGPSVTLVPIGRPWRALVPELARHPETAALRLDAASARAGEDPGGLNIEGLAAGPEGALWMGFRNPVPAGRVLIIPLLNPDEVLQGTPARFGSPFRPDLGGLGIRDLARRSDGEGWWILGGPAEGGGRHRLFIWDGSTAAPREIAGAVPKGFQAEGLLTSSSTMAGGEVTLLGDEGGEKVGGKRCEQLADWSQRRFHAVRVTTP